MKKKVLWSQKHPFFYFLSVWSKRLKRQLAWYLDGRQYARIFSGERLPFRVKKHQSVLIKKLGNSDRQLQINKVTNLKIALAGLNGLIIRPGEVFSFCRLVGRPTKKRGFLPGMELSFGKPRAGIGGGICQISNLIHWLVLHSPLTITERRHHSFDPFPDDGRILPFGSGAAVFYNYIDYQFENRTSHIFQLVFRFTEKCLEGELLCDASLDWRYHIFETNHAFLKIEDCYYRRNELWRVVRLQSEGGREVCREKVAANFVRVMYVPVECEKAPEQPGGCWL